MRLINKSEYSVIVNAMRMEVSKGNLDKIRFLIDKGADLNHKHLLGDTVLHRAAEEGQLNVVKFLVEQGMMVDITNDHGNTALHHAARAGHIQCASVLIDLGADVCIKNNDGKTPLEIAKENDEKDVVCFLLSLEEQHLLDKEMRENEHVPSMVEF